LIRLKKTIVIVILIVFLLNAIGFYGILIGLQFRIASETNHALDEDKYSTAEAITVKVPVSLPYSMDEENYHRVTGEFEHDGEVYRLVKQRFHGDTLYIVCVKDTKSKKINLALNDYVKTFTDHPLSAKQQGTKLVPSIIKDYLNTGISIENGTNGWKECVSFKESTDHYFSFYASKIKYPPKFFPLNLNA
jgi:hypothetical protein